MGVWLRFEHPGLGSGITAIASISALLHDSHLHSSAVAPGIGQGVCFFRVWGGGRSWQVSIQLASRFCRAFASVALSHAPCYTVSHRWGFRFRFRQGLAPAHQLREYVRSVTGLAWGVARLGSTHDDHHGCTFRFRPLLWGLSGSRRGVSSSPSRFRSGFSWGGCQAPRQP